MTKAPEPKPATRSKRSAPEEAVDAVEEEPRSASAAARERARARAAQDD